MHPVIFGTSGLGNLFKAVNEADKCAIVGACIDHVPSPVMFDSAGKYGAGLALESLGNALRALQVSPTNVVISNKLGWLRSELLTDEPTFEPGVWKDLRHDAVQNISYEGILECYDQGNALLNGYTPQWVSVHDADEYLSRAGDNGHAQRLYADILGAYRALTDLKAVGKVQAVGIGAKDWRVIRRLANDVELDWVMIANSLTIKEHPADLLSFVGELKQRGITIINSAVFHAGFLTGGEYYDYKRVSPDTPDGKALLTWRKDFFRICHIFQVRPAHACIQFGLHIPGVGSIALNTTEVSRVRENVHMAREQLPQAFWNRMKETGLINRHYPHV